MMTSIDATVCLLVLQQVFCISRSLSRSEQFVSAPCGRDSITDPERVAAAVAGQITALIGLTRGDRLYGGLRQQDALAVRGIVRLSSWRLAEVSSAAHSQKTTTTTNIDFFSVSFNVIVFFRKETKRENPIRVQEHTGTHTQYRNVVIMFQKTCISFLNKLMHFFSKDKMF